MAQLRDRFASHNFDDNGNDTNMKSFMDAISKLPITKELKDIAAIIKEQKEINKLEKQYYKEQLKEKLGKGIANLPKNAMAALGGGVIETGKAIGSGAKALAGDTADFAGRGINTLLAASGPVGYALAGALNVGKGVAGLVKAFGKGATSRSGDKGNGLTSEGGSLATRSGDGLPSFETYPTIKKLSHFMDAKISMDTKLNKAYDAVAAFSEKGYNADLKQYKEQDKMAKAQKKVLDEMQKDTSVTALQSKAIIAAIVVGSILVGTAAIKGFQWLKDHWPFGKGPDLETPPSTSEGGVVTNYGGGGEYQSFGITPGQTAGVIDVHDASGKVIGTREHYGVDFAAKKGTIVSSNVEGTAFAFAEYNSGFGYFDPKRIETVKGYGLFVDVECSARQAKELGYPGKIVTFRYAHLSAIDPMIIKAGKKGAKVKFGTRLGLSGDTGTGGEHIHYEIFVNGTPVKEQQVKGKRGQLLKSQSLRGGGYVIDPLKLQMKGIDLATGKTKIMPSTASFQSASSAQGSAKTLQGPFSSTQTVAEEILDTTEGVPTGPAASIDYDLIDSILSTEGKNDINMSTNNIGLRRSLQNGSTITSQQQSKPIVINNTSQKQEESTTLLYDLENDATKAMKNARPQVDFWQ